MISKETEKQILHDLCNNELLPILKEFGFKYLKSKSHFVIKGEEVDLELKITIVQGSAQLNSKNPFQIKYRVQPILRPVKFNRWYEKTLKRKKSFVHTPQLNYSFFYLADNNLQSSQKNHEPNKSSIFKRLFSSFFNRPEKIPEPDNFDNLEDCVQKEILPLYEKLNNLEVLPLDNNSGSVRSDILFYLGKEKKAKESYVASIQELSEKIAQEENLRTKGHLTDLSKELIRKHNLLFDDKIENKVKKSSVTVNKDLVDKLTIGILEYHLVGSLNKVFPPPKDILIHSETFRIIHEKNQVTHWDFELNTAERPKVNWETPTIPPAALKLIPPNTYKLAQSLSKDGKFLFVGGYNTKSYLIDIEKETKHVLWAHETFKEGYKEKYNVSHNFGVHLSRFLHGDKYILACANHAKNVYWKTSTLERFELDLPYEFTFEGAPQGTEFANDVRQIETFNTSNYFALVIRNHALICDDNFEIISKIENVHLIRISDSEDIIAVMTSDNEIKIYKLKP